MFSHLARIPPLRPRRIVVLARELLHLSDGRAQARFTQSSRGQATSVKLEQGIAELTRSSLISKNSRCIMSLLQESPSLV
jgi:hypothetical protein